MCRLVPRPRGDAQAALAPRSTGGRKSPNGPPIWKRFTDNLELDDEQLAD